MPTTKHELICPTDAPDAPDARVLELLASPASYPEPTGRVDLIETHISCVFLTDRFVYKLKKPVKYDFLDFSTPAMRRRACEQEVRLNRRLARDVYLGVEPITSGQHGEVQLGGAGPPVDWVVKMRRLPAARALDRLIAAGHVDAADVHTLAVRLTQFYDRLPPLNVDTEHYLQHLESHLAGNRRDLDHAEIDSGMRNRLHTAQLRFLRLASGLLAARVCDGRLVDGHGDLRPEHIYFNPEPTIIDCIEFNDEFRQLDVLDELAFLAVECEQLGAAWIGDRVIEQYRVASRDAFAGALLDFYKTYRACVRAKVLVLRGAQVQGDEGGRLRDEARRYLQLAERHAENLGGPMLLVVYGLSGTGKSTLARRLADSFEIDVLATDAVRRTLFANSGPAAYDEGVYAPEHRAHVYDELFERAARLLGDGRSAILDGTFPTADLRRRAAELATHHGAAAQLVHCECDAETARGRIAERELANTNSDATIAIYEQQRLCAENDPADLPVCRVDTRLGLDEMTGRVYRELRRQLGLPAAD